MYRAVDLSSRSPNITRIFRCYYRLVYGIPSSLEGILGIDFYLLGTRVCYVTEFFFNLVRNFGSYKTPRSRCCFVNSKYINTELWNRLYLYIHTYIDSLAVFFSNVIKLFDVHFSSEVDVPFCQDKWVIMKLYSRFFLMMNLSSR